MTMCCQDDEKRTAALIARKEDERKRQESKIQIIKVRMLYTNRSSRYALLVWFACLFCSIVITVYGFANV